MILTAILIEADRVAFQREKRLATMIGNEIAQRIGRMFR